MTHPSNWLSSALGASSLRALPRPLRWGLLLGGGLVCLGVLTALMPSAAPEASAASRAPLLSVGNLLAVLLLAGSGAFALYLRGRGPEPTPDATPLRALGTLPLGPDGQQLRLVACGDDVLLLGVTAEQVALLRTYDRDAFDASALDADARVATAGDGAATRAPSLADLIRHYTSHA